MPSSKRKPNQTSIVIRDAHAVVDAPQKLFFPLAVHTAREYSLGADGTMTAKLTPTRPFFETDHRGRTCVHLGLVPHIIEALTEAGCPPVVRTELAESALAEADGGDRSLVKHICEPWDQLAEACLGNQLGVIGLPGPGRVIDAIMIICDLFPGRNVLVLAAKSRQVRWLCRELRIATKEEVEHQIKKQPPRCRIVVSTFGVPQVPEAVGVIISCRSPRISKTTSPTTGCSGVFGAISAGSPSPRTMCRSASGPATRLRRSLASGSGR